MSKQRLVEATLVAAVFLGGKSLFLRQPQRQAHKVLMLRIGAWPNTAAALVMVVVTLRVLRHAQGQSELNYRSCRPNTRTKSTLGLV